MPAEFDYSFREHPVPFKSASQTARVWTEEWVVRQMYCPACGEVSLRGLPNNAPVADFHCDNCSEIFELKSTKSQFGRKIVDGAYQTMINRLQSHSVPNLMLMTYDASRSHVTSLIVVPSQFITPSIIEKRKPLASTARRAGWQGCNILWSDVPAMARIGLVENQVAKPIGEVLDNWSRLKFVKDTSYAARGWLFEVWHCIETLGRPEFTLSELYGFEQVLSQKYPDNKNIRAKIRQQLQVLRDANFLMFLGLGRYLVRQ